MNDLLYLIQKWDLPSSSLLILALGCLAVAVLMQVALWRLFDDFGEPGWKSLIPYYSCHLLYSNVWKARYYYITLAVSIACGLYPVLLILWLILNCILCYKIAQCYRCNLLMTIGLILFPYVFLPIVVLRKNAFFFGPPI